MEAVSVYLQANLDVVYFIYGAAFVVMGITILLQPRKSGGFPLAETLDLLGWFGLIHGANEWLDMWAIIKHPEGAAFEPLRLLVLTVSYAFLFEFGRRTVRAKEAACSPLLAKTARFMGWQVLPVLFLATAALAVFSSSFIKDASVLSRYLIGFPGAMLTGVGLLNYYRCQALELKTIQARNYLIVAGIAFLLYGALGGLIPARTGFFPASLLNTELFLAATSLPVQLFRAVCAVFITWGVIGALRVFNRQRDELIEGVVFNHSQDLIANISLDGRFLAVNKSGLAAYELSGDWEVLGKDAVTGIAINAEKFAGSVSRAAKGGVSALQYSTVGKKGREAWWDAVISPVTGLNGEIKSVLCVAKDITGHLLSREQLRRNQETQSIINEILSLAIENVALEAVLGRVLDRIFTVTGLGVQKKGAILLTDPTRKFLTMAVQRGLTGDIERTCANVPFGRCLCGKAALSGETVFAEDVDDRHEVRYKAMKPHGHYCLPIKVRDRVLGVLTLYVPAGHKRDKAESDFLEAICAIIAKMIEYKNLEARAFQVQKMESLGRFAGAMAHDFNNILTGIKGFNSLAIETTPETAESHRYLKEAASGIDKGAGLIQQILAFGRNQPAEMTRLDLNAVIAEMEPMLKMLLERKIRLKLSLSPAMPAVTGNKSQFEQIVVNLAVNARDAMPKGGEFSITTQPVEPGMAGQCPADFKSKALCAKLSVADTGTGIPEELTERVFEPFFTTKPEGEGTGLGLSTVYSLVKLHKGSISVTSRVNQGTAFTICFPAAGPEKTPA